MKTKDVCGFKRNQSRANKILKRFLGIIQEFIFNSTFTQIIIQALLHKMYC